MLFILTILDIMKVLVLMTNVKNPSSHIQKRSKYLTVFHRPIIWSYLICITYKRVHYAGYNT